jgi:tripartite-type tricarboxylate transporter receptor subunit TctC
MKYIKWIATAALGGIFAVPAMAQYPTKVITMVVPFAAGGPTDTLGRNLGQAMGKQLKQTIIIENVGGAGGNIGVTRVSRAAPDGYSLLLHHIGMSTSPALYRKLDYNPLTDFEYIGLVADVPMTVIARGNFPAKDFREFLTYIKANKDKVSLANAGLGAASHLCGLLFMTAIETDFTTVPYKGTAPAMNDLLGGQVDFMCDQTTNTTGQIQGGKVKAYGVTTRTRVASLPNLPTLDEQGMKGFEVAVWHAVYAPKGTPKPTLDILVHALQESLKDVELKTNLAKLGTEPVAQNRATPEALRTFLKSEIDKWGPIIKKAGQYAD